MDNGKEFKNHLMTRINKLFRVMKLHTTTYNPRANGLVEGHNRILKDQLYHYVNVRGDNWDVFLPTVQLMYNTTVNSSTGFTPHYRMFGRECRMPEEFCIQVSEEEKDKSLVKKTYLEYSNELVESLTRAWQVVSEQAEIQAYKYNKDLVKSNREEDTWLQLRRGYKFVEYQEGDYFFRKRNPIREFKSAGDEQGYKINRKMQARYEGPYMITRKISPLVYEAEISGERVKVHAINMKPDVRG